MRLVFVSLVVGSGQAQGAKSPELRPLSDVPLTAAQEDQLKQLVSRPAPGHIDIVNRLRVAPSQAMVSRLISMAEGKSVDARLRAIFALSQIPARESLRAAVQLALGDARKSVRETASAFLLASGIPDQLRAAKLIESVAKGLVDKSGTVRFHCASILAKVGKIAAVPILKAGLRHRDHHRREVAAELLAELGDPSGVPQLIKMIRYTDRNHPFLVANGVRKMAAEERLWFLGKVNAERIRVCGHLGRLCAKKAVSALKRLQKHADSGVVKAATTAIQAISGQ